MNQTSSASSVPAGTPVPPITDTIPVNPETLARDALADVAVLIGSAAALHHLDDDLIWTLMKRLDRIRVRLLRDLRGLAPREEYEPVNARPPRIHSAVDEFLVRTRVGMGE